MAKKKEVFVIENENKEYKCPNCGKLSVLKKGICTRCGKERK